MQKLSTCIREGAKKRPQAFGDYIRQMPVDESGWNYKNCTCALGAAYEHITGKLPQPDWLYPQRTKRAIYKECDVQGTRIPYPESVLSGAKAYVVDVVSSLNDSFKWSREQIADYLESLGY